MSTLAHLSDLHLGASESHDWAAAELVCALLREQVDHVVVTGDVTHAGTEREYLRFQRLFAPLLLEGRLTVVPGNHDCGADDVAARMLPEGKRVDVEETSDLYLVRIDSTAPHNREASYRSHGDVCARVLADVDAALAGAPPEKLCALLMHHHPVHLPEESFVERFATFMGWPHASELALGEDLLRLALGRCDLALHGHRHVPRELHIAAESTRPLRVFNAGSSTQLRRFRVFEQREGALLGEPSWVSLTEATGSLGLRPSAADPALEA
jgi:3',5'-cyclic-AMP phosphodiesterase